MHFPQLSFSTAVFFHVEVKVNRGKIQNKSAHVPKAVGIITVCRPKKEFGSPPMIYMGEDCIEVLLQFIQSEVSRVHNILKKCPHALYYDT